MSFLKDIFGEKGAMIFFAVCGIIILLILLLIISTAMRKKSRKKRLERDIQRVNALVAKSLPGIKDLTVVFANKTGSTSNSRGKKSYTYENFIYAFKEWESYAIPITFKGERVIAAEPIRLALDNVSKILIRYMKTNAKFYDNEGNEIIEFTVAALNTKQIADECPFEIDQVESAQKYFTFIERFESKINHKNAIEIKPENNKQSNSIMDDDLNAKIDEILSNEPLYDDHTEEGLLRK